MDGRLPIHARKNGWQPRWDRRHQRLENSEAIPKCTYGHDNGHAYVDGDVCAFTDNCTHISGPLNEGELDGEVLTCPWHGAQFNVRTGKVLRGPARQDILTYAVKIEDKSILVSLPEE